MARIIFDPLTSNVAASSAIGTINAIADQAATTAATDYDNSAIGDLYYDMYVEIAQDSGATLTVGQPLVEFYAVGGLAAFLPAAGAGVLRAEHLVATITASTTGANALYVLQGLPLTPQTLRFDLKNVSGVALDFTDANTAWRLHPYSLKTV